MNYYHFLLKKTLKSRGNLILLTILLSVIVGLYIINITSGDSYSFTNTVKDDYRVTLQQEKEYVEELNSHSYGEEDTTMYKEALQDIVEQKNWNEQILELADQGKWSDALDYSIKIVNRHLEVNEKSGGDLFPADYVTALKNEIILFEQLRALNQEPDTEAYELFGFNYVYRVMDSLFPMFFVLILSVFLTDIFLSTHKNGFEIEKLLPSSFIGTMTKRIVFSTLIATSVYVFALMFSFIIASIANGMGSLHYPIIIHSTSTPHTSPVWNVLAKTFILQVLSILTIVLLISLLSLFVKNRLIHLFTSVVITIGSSIAVKAIEAFNPYLHLNPFLYFSSADVVTQSIISETNNPNITFGTGVILLCLLAVILYTAIYMICRRGQSPTFSSASTCQD
ncbi:hypothetical protein [Metabacillus malikii]|uniref:ABC transporter permease n=1 Tax=Metabacillus malikii TaxID=1504265 RepID=A0ABT9ZGL0_9BACI|nr:hypothetical protein [Metabacillus malikii]MDQ0231406.1 hypothetical protein [Metabacillus malikii]